MGERRGRRPNVIVFTVFLLLGCGDTAREGELGGPPEVMSEAANVWFGSSSIWYRPIIPVCWENPSPADAEQRGWVRAAVEQTWGAVSRLSFTGWEACNSLSRGIRILSYDGVFGSLTAGLGSALDGKPEGMILNLTYQNSYQKCRITEPNGSIRINKNCVNVDAIHEFGHALGFAHEHSRPDKPVTCTETADNSKGDYLLDGWDLNSVMNFCNPRIRNRWDVTTPNPPMYVLSANDVRGVQQLYGAKPNTLVGFWGKCIDLNGSALTDGTRLVTADCKNKSEQRWLLDWAPNTTVYTGKLRSVAAGSTKVASLINLSLADGTPLELRNRNDNLQVQAWMMSRGTSDMTIRGHAGRCMDVVSNNAADGTRLHLWSCGPYVNTNGAQLWRRDEAGRIINRNGKCLDVPYGQTANGTPVQMWTCNNNTNQIWDLQSPGRLRSRRSGKCLDAYEFRTDGAPLVIWDCNDYVNQHWSFRGPIRTRPSVDAAYKCMNIAADAVGTPVGVSACTGSEWQLFDYHW